MNNIAFRWIPRSVIALALTAHASGAYSQVLEEVIVTAQKRAQSIQDVPLAISAFDGGALAEANVADIQGLINMTPGLSGKANSTDTQDISVRGITTNDFGIGGEPSVGIFRNGIYDSAMNIFHDLERVEVVRGPQGLLFGRGAASGAINMITAKADPRGYYGELGMGGGERGQQRGRLTLNAPLNENWAIRVAGLYAKEDGWVENLLGGDDLGADEQKALRVSLAYANGPWSLDVVADYEERDKHAPIYSLLDENGDPVTGEINVIAADRLDDTRDDVELASIGVFLSYEFDTATFTSLTGLRSREFDLREDLDGAPVTLIHDHQTEDNDYFSQEFRLVSHGEGDWSWFVGASTFLDSVDGFLSIRGDEDTYCDAFVGLPCGAIIPGFEPTPGGYAESGTGESRVWGAAVYGELGYQLSDALHVSLGLRYNYDDREFTQFSNPAVGGLYEAFGRFGLVFPYETLEEIKSDENWSYLAPRLKLEYSPQDDLLLFASVTKGVKPGGFDSITAAPIIPGFPTPFAAPDAEVNSFDEEELWSYEVGAKGQLAAGKLKYAVSGYYYDYSDLQQQVIVGVFPTVKNVGEVTGAGVEGEIIAVPHEMLDVRMGFAWSDTEVDEIDLDACVEKDGSSCAGNELGKSPEWTAYLVATGRYRIGGNNELFGTVEYLYSDSYFTGLENSPITYVDSYDEVNLRAGVDLGERLSISVFVENVTDEEYFFSAFEIPALSMAIARYPVKPRTWGADLVYRFGE